MKGGGEEEKEEEEVEVFTISLCMRMVMITHICTFPARGENFLMTGFLFLFVTHFPLQTNLLSRLFFLTSEL